MRVALILLILSVLLSACGGAASESVDRAAPSRLGSFGFVAVDCRFDDPYDAPQGARDYVEEVGAFTNVAHTCVFAPTDDLHERLAKQAAHGMRALLHVESVLFTQVPDPTAPTGLRDALVPGAQENWQRFVTLNADVLDSAHVASFYLVDEPYLNHLPPADFDAAVAIVAATHPSIPRSFVEAWSALDGMHVPLGIDWLGFDDYQIADPSRDPRYLGSLAKLKAARSRPDQRLMIIMDAQWTPTYPATAGLLPGDMAQVAERYLDLARSEPDTVALIGYVWPGGLDAGQLGARELPDNVQAVYRRIGKDITGK